MSPYLGGLINGGVGGGGYLHPEGFITGKNIVSKQAA